MSDFDDYTPTERRSLTILLVVVAVWVAFLIAAIGTGLWLAGRALQVW